MVKESKKTKQKTKQTKCKHVCNLANQPTTQNRGQKGFLNLSKIKVGSLVRTPGGGGVGVVVVMDQDREGGKEVESPPSHLVPPYTHPQPS